VRSILDAELPEQVIWPARADCGGLSWTRAFFWKRKVGGSTRPWPHFWPAKTPRRISPTGAFDSNDDSNRRLIWLNRTLVLLRSGIVWWAW